MYEDYRQIFGMYLHSLVPRSLSLQSQRLPFLNKKNLLSTNISDGQGLAYSFPPYTPLQKRGRVQQKSRLMFQQRLSILASSPDCLPFCNVFFFQHVGRRLFFAFILQPPLIKATFVVKSDFTTKQIIELFPRPLVSCQKQYLVQLGGQANTQITMRHNVRNTYYLYMSDNINRTNYYSLQCKDVLRG